MRVYVEFIKNAFKENLAYRTGYFARFAGTIIRILVQVYLWRALLGYSGQASTNIGVVTLGDMTTYIMISAMISTLTDYTYVIYYIDNRIKTGLIAMDLIKPLNFQAHMFSRMIGNNLFSFLFRLLPVLVFGIVFFGMKYPSAENLLLFSVTILNGIVISFQMGYIVGLIGFWYLSVWQLRFLLSSLIRLFSGIWIPLWFFPRVLVEIANFLPFRLIFFAPISIYLGKVEFIDGLYMFMQQIIWITVFFVITKIVWSRGIRKLVVQGG